MAEFFYLFFCALLAALIIYNIFVYRRTGRLTTLLFMLNGIGLLWENGVIASGRFIGQGSLLQSLNMGRYCLHFAFVPLMVWPLLEQLRAAGAAWAGGRLARTVCAGFILGLILLGFGSGAAGLYARLEPADLNGVLRYSAPNPASALIAIAIMSAALVSGGILWFRFKWPWLCLAALLCFVIEGALLNAGMFGMVAGNGSEVVFQLALLQTELFVSGRQS
jgi:hypothetical protein